MSIRVENIRRLFTQFNDAGKGFSIGEEDTDINDLADRGELVCTAKRDTDYAVYTKGSKTTIVANIYGPWAVEVNTCELEG